MPNEDADKSASVASGLLQMQHFSSRSPGLDFADSPDRIPIEFLKGCKFRPLPPNAGQL
jgi:hypothetical protein